MQINKRKKIVVIGCSNMGARIAGYLCSIGDAVTIIDRDSTAFRKLPHIFSGFQIEGDGMEFDVLKRANVEKADIVLVATDDDNVNSMISQMCKCVLNVSKVIVRMDESDADDILSDQGIEIIHPSDLSLRAYLNLDNRGDE